MAGGLCGLPIDALPKPMAMLLLLLRGFAAADDDDATHDDDDDADDDVRVVPMLTGAGERAWCRDFKTAVRVDISYRCVKQERAKQGLS